VTSKFSAAQKAPSTAMNASGALIPRRQAGRSAGDRKVGAVKLFIRAQHRSRGRAVQSGKLRVRLGDSP
jgi:hypothetical protein